MSEVKVVRDEQGNAIVIIPNIIFGINRTLTGMQ